MTLKSPIMLLWPPDVMSLIHVRGRRADLTQVTDLKVWKDGMIHRRLCEKKEWKAARTEMSQRRQFSILVTCSWRWLGSRHHRLLCVCVCVSWPVLLECVFVLEEDENRSGLSVSCVSRWREEAALHPSLTFWTKLQYKKHQSWKTPHYWWLYSLRDQTDPAPDQRKVLITVSSED